MPRVKRQLDLEGHQTDFIEGDWQPESTLSGEGMRTSHAGCLNLQAEELGTIIGFARERSVKVCLPWSEADWIGGSVVRNVIDWQVPTAFETAAAFADDASARVQWPARAFFERVAVTLHGRCPAYLR